MHFTGAAIHKDAEACAREVHRVLHNHAGDYRFVDTAVDAVRRYRHKHAHVHTYNLSVADDESYVIKGGMVVHNCRCVVIPVIDAESMEQGELPLEEE